MTQPVFRSACWPCLQFLMLHQRNFFPSNRSSVLLSSVIPTCIDNILNKHFFILDLPSCAKEIWPTQNAFTTLQTQICHVEYEQEGLAQCRLMNALHMNWKKNRFCGSQAYHHELYMVNSLINYP